MVSTKASDLTIGKLSAREIAKPPSSARSVDVDSIKAPSSSRSVDKDIVPSSSRSNPASSDTSRSQPVETYRTYMDTGRVHTALAALTAEKSALLAKLNLIDSALEGSEKKKASLPRPKK